MSYTSSLLFLQVDHKRVCAKKESSIENSNNNDRIKKRLIVLTQFVQVQFRTRRWPPEKGEFKKMLSLFKIVIAGLAIFTDIYLRK